MSSLWELWVEVSQESDSLADPVLLQCFAGGKSLRIFDEISDEELKGVLGKIKGLLNEPKNREKGATVFNEFVTCVDSKRLIGLQDALLSALRLICNEKYLKSGIVQTALANFLPKCKQLPDILKELTPKNAYISKIMSSCAEELQRVSEEKHRQPNVQTLNLLRICMENFKGICGNYRERIEKSLVLFLDHDNVELVQIVCNIFPLMSQTGGGGSRGDNHSKDWLTMVKKLMKEAYDCLYILYSDCSSLDDENPFAVAGEEANMEKYLQPIVEKKVFAKICAVKKRLINLLQVINAYLRNAFPAQKPVPLQSILNLVSLLISVNPMELLESQNQKELLYLAALIPTIHASAFKLLENLVKCVGTNILPEAVAVEQLFSQEWRWIENKRNAFLDLKECLYSSLIKWLDMTKGQVSTQKTTNQWQEHFMKEIQLEKETVELRTLNVKSKNKNNSKMPISSNLNTSLSSLNTNNSFILKNPKICEMSLEILKKLLPSFDAVNHKIFYTVVINTHVHLYQQGSYPNQYQSTESRIKLSELLLELAINPNSSNSNISLGLVTNLFKKALVDSSPQVASVCVTALSTLERLIHPSSQSLEFPQTSFIQTSVDQSSAILDSLMMKNKETNSGMDVDDGEEKELADFGCQTDLILVEEKPEESEEENPLPINELMTELRALRQEIGKINIPSIYYQPATPRLPSQEKIQTLEGIVQSPKVNGVSSFVPTINGVDKSPQQDDTVKDTEVFNDGFNSELIEMFDDFVDVGAQGSSL